MTHDIPTDREAVERLADTMQKLGCFWEVGDTASENRARNFDVTADTLRALLARAEAAEAREKKAIDLAVRFGGIDGGHHKAWVIDQMVRALAGENYDKIVQEACDGKDGPETYGWDEGIAP